VSALAERGGDEVVGALVEASLDRDPNVRAAAINFLAVQSGRASADALIALLPASSGQDRAAIVAGLARPEPDRVTALLDALGGEGDELVPELVGALARIRTPAAIAALATVAERARPLVRRAAASGLAAVGTREAVQVVQRLAADDPDADVRQVCAVLLAS
jgi:HEAT repeat protein